MLRTASSILVGLRVDEAGIARNLAIYGPFAATEGVLIALVKAGADRQAMHEALRRQAMAAWQAIQDGRENPLIEALCADSVFTQYLPEAQIRALMTSQANVGDAPVRARDMAKAMSSRVE